MSLPGFKLSRVVSGPGLPLGMVLLSGEVPSAASCLAHKCVLGLELEWQPPDAWPTPGHGVVVLQDSLLYQSFPP